jgi:hypothetical protein
MPRAGAKPVPLIGEYATKGKQWAWIDDEDLRMLEKEYGLMPPFRVHQQGHIFQTKYLNGTIVPVPIAEVIADAVEGKAVRYRKKDKIDLSRSNLYLIDNPQASNNYRALIAAAKEQLINDQQPMSARPKQYRVRPPKVRFLNDKRDQANWRITSQTKQMMEEIAKQKKAS